MAPRASVIIATYRRPEMLAGCLDRLVCDGSTVDREVLVVDNGSGDNTAEVVQSRAERTNGTPVRFLVEPRSGQVHARNRGVAEARGEVFLFLDDDMLVDRRWTDRLVGCFEDPATIAATGRVLPAWPIPPPAWLAGPHAVFLTSPDYGDVRRPLKGPAQEHILGNNMAVHARALDTLQPLFDPTIGHAANVSMGGDDVWLSRRLQGLGNQWYEPEAVAHHCIPQDRLEWGWFRRRFWQGGIGLARMERRGGSAQPVLARRLVRALRTTRAAWALRHKHARRENLGPDEAFDEFYAFFWAGKHVEMLLGRFPSLTDWLAAHACR
jgi:glycosyltransferase involved in cell wall biosynthesis